MSPKHDKASMGRHVSPAAGVRGAHAGKAASSSERTPAQPKASVSSTAAMRSVGVHAAASNFVAATQKPNAASACSAPNASTLNMPPQKGGKGKKVALVLGVILALFVAAYCGIALYFSKSFVPNTTLGPLDVSLMSTEEAEAAVVDLVDGYTLHVEGLGFSSSYASDQLGIKADQTEVVKAAHAMINHWLWPLELLEPHDVSAALVASYDASTMKGEVAEQIDAFNADKTMPVNASLSYDSDADKFTIAPDEVGTAVDANAVVDAMNAAIVALNDSVKLDESHLLQPAVKSNDARLAMTLDQANKMIAVDFDITVNGEVVVDGGPDISNEWIVIGENAEVAFDDEAMQAWSDELAKGFNTVGTKRTYTRPDGKECTVEGGTYGWAADTSGLLDQVKAALSEGKNTTIELPCKKMADHYAEPGEQDWGSRYIDIDLKEQHVRFYDGDQVLWESDCISGKPNGSDTPTGVYVINGKQSPSTLIGYEDGEKTYESEVSYWMPFVGNLVGLHDADWQPSFGGNLYAIGYGSHGCVNLPVSKAGELYDMVKVGDVVVCHW